MAQKSGTFSSAMIATIVVAVLGALASLGGAYLSYTQANRELDVKLIEIAVGILRTDPKETNLRAARGWAVDVIERSSSIKFTASDKAELTQRPLGIKWHLGTAPFPGLLDAIEAEIKKAPKPQ